MSGRAAGCVRVDHNDHTGPRRGERRGPSVRHLPESGGERCGLLRCRCPNWRADRHELGRPLWAEPRPVDHPHDHSTATSNVRGIVHPPPFRKGLGRKRAFSARPTRPFLICFATSSTGARRPRRRMNSSYFQAIVPTGILVAGCIADRLMSDAPKKGLKPPMFGQRGASRERPERPLPGTTYAAPVDPIAAAATRRKRTVGVSLVLAGVGAVGLYAYERRQQCLEQNPQNPDSCRSSSRSSSSSGSSSNSSQRVPQTTTSRGGFGSFFRGGGG